VLWFLPLVLLFLVLLLWLPLEVEIDTGLAVYRARWWGVFGIRAVPDSEKWRWFLNVFFWENELRPGGTKPSVRKRRANKKKRTIPLKRILSLAKNLFQAIKIKRFRLDWDTGDFVSNAQLYPLFHALSNRKRQLAINFDGKEELEILLQTRLWDLTKAVLRSFVQPK
jgi:hypothetical protein